MFRRLVPLSLAFGLVLPGASALIMMFNQEGALAEHRLAQFPIGASEVISMPGLQGGWEGPPFGGGMYVHEYTCPNTEQFNEALRRFARIQAPKLELVVHDGRKSSMVHRDSGLEIQWTLTLWSPESWYRLHRAPGGWFEDRSPYQGAEVPPPTIDVWTGGDIDWSQVEVPKGIEVVDDRLSAAPIQPIEGGVVEGTVTSMTNLRALPGAEIAVWRMERRERNERVAGAIVDGSGHYLVRVSSATGAFQLVATSPGMATRTLDYGHYEPNQYTRMDIALAPETKAEGVLLTLAGEPVAGATIAAREVRGLDGTGYGLPEPAEACTDTEGRFAFKGMPRGWFQVRAPQGEYYVDPPFTWHSAPTYEPISVAVKVTGSIQVRVTDRVPGIEYLVDLDEKPRVSPNPWGGGGTVKDDGTYEYTGVPPGRYAISVRRNPDRTDDPNHTPEKIVTVEGGKTVEVNLAAY